MPLSGWKVEREEEKVMSIAEQYHTQKEFLSSLGDVG